MSLTFADDGQQAADIAQRASRGEAVIVTGDKTRTRLLLEVADRLGSASAQPVVVHVAGQLDRVAHVVLTIAAQCGRAALAEVAGELGASPLDAALGALARRLGARPLLVDDVHRLSGWGENDPDLWRTVSQDARTLQAWLVRHARVATFDGVRQSTFHPVETRPDEGSRELWERVGRDPDRFALAHARVQLGAEVSDDDAAWDAASLVRDVWRVCAPRPRDLLATLAVHGRSVARHQLLDLKLTDRATFEYCLGLGLVEPRGRGEVGLSRPWYAHCPDLEPAQRAAHHLRLGKTFASATHRADADPRFVLEAHRHLSEAGEVDAAAEFARYGAVLLLDAARRKSHAREWRQAAHAYDVVLKLPELDTRHRAYAVHYRSYNRFKADLDPIDATLRGYEVSLELWPQNALFWSRLVRGWFIAGDREQALARLEQAYKVVPSHPERTRVLAGETMAGLLDPEHDRVQDAVLAWGDTDASRALLPYETQLKTRLAEGFVDDHFYCAGRELALYEPRLIHLTPAAEEWSARGLDKTAKGPTPRAALEAWARAVREEAALYLRAATHTLTPEQRMRARALLSTVDVIASKIGPREETAWVTGELVRDGDEVLLATRDGERHLLPAKWHDQLDMPAPYRVARVALDERERPYGPVLELAPSHGGDVEAQLEEWKRRADGG